jgi:hypothetical protein
MLQRELADLALDPRPVARDRTGARAEAGHDGGHGRVVELDPLELRQDRLRDVQRASNVRDIEPEEYARRLYADGVATRSDLHPGPDRCIN